MIPTAPETLKVQHFAYLRSVAEGLSAVEAAKRYLQLEHASALQGVHRKVVELARAVVRRQGDSRWRLIGIEIPGEAAHDTPTDAPPPLLEWAEAERLGDWSEDELQAMYAERFGTDVEAGTSRRNKRNRRLRALRLELLRRLEATASQGARPTDTIVGWMQPVLAQRLLRAGMLTLEDLQHRIAQGGRWWRAVPTLGPTKAARIEAFVAALLGPGQLQPRWPVDQARAELQRLAGVHGANRSTGATCGISATNDREAVQAWVAARAGSPRTALQYEREAERFMLWCILERSKALSDATAEDCTAYKDFIRAVPPDWISRRRAARFSVGWAPFRGPLHPASQRVALDTLNGLFAWLVRVRYLEVNPWDMVNRKLGDAAAHADAGPGSRAFTPQAWVALFEHLDAATRSDPSTARLRWLCIYLQTVGLRSSELLNARRKHMKQEGTGWVLIVERGKGGKNRKVPVPAIAVTATRTYFKERGLDFDTADGQVPLISTLADPSQPLSYSTLYDTFTRFVRRAIARSDLPPDQKDAAVRASAHWLRHTYATRAAERGMAPDILQANLGQSDPRTTAKYYPAQLERRQRAVEETFNEKTERGVAHPR